MKPMDFAVEPLRNDIALTQTTARGEDETKDLAVLSLMLTQSGHKWSDVIAGSQVAFTLNIYEFTRGTPSKRVS